MGVFPAASEIWHVSFCFNTIIWQNTKLLCLIRWTTSCLCIRISQFSCCALSNYKAGLLLEQLLCDSACLLLLQWKWGLFSVNWSIDLLSTYCLAMWALIIVTLFCCFFICVFIGVELYLYLLILATNSVCLLHFWENGPLFHYFFLFSHAASSGQP